MLERKTNVFHCFYLHLAVWRISTNRTVSPCCYRGKSISSIDMLRSPSKAKYSSSSCSSGATFDFDLQLCKSRREEPWADSYMNHWWLKCTDQTIETRDTSAVCSSLTLTSEGLIMPAQMFFGFMMNKWTSCILERDTGLKVLLSGVPAWAATGLTVLE